MAEGQDGKVVLLPPCKAFLDGLLFGDFSEGDEHSKHRHLFEEQEGQDQRIGFLLWIWHFLRGVLSGKRAFHASELLIYAIDMYVLPTNDQIKIC